MTVLFILYSLILLSLNTKSLERFLAHFVSSNLKPFKRYIEAYRCAHAQSCIPVDRLMQTFWGCLILPLTRLKFSKCFIF